MKLPGTITITNFGGPLTRRIDGNIESGLAKFDTSWGYNPYSKPGNLTWMEQPTSILTQASNLGAFVTMEQHVESPYSYQYVFSNSGTLRKVLIVNDTASVIGALGTAPSASNGADMLFYGATEKIFYGDDRSIQKINLDGSSPSLIAASGANFVTDMPRPMTNFQGKIYFGNGTNIGEIDSTEAVTTGAKLSPGLPTGVRVRDLDVTPDGNYMTITAMRYNPTGGFVFPDSGVNAGIESFKFLWNGTDLGVTASKSYPGVGLTATTSVGDDDYATGYEPTGTALLDGAQKELSLPRNNSPFPSGLFSVGNTLGIATTEYELPSTRMRASLYMYGQYDSEVPRGLYRLLRLNPGVRADVLTIQGAQDVSNILYAPSIYGVANDLFRHGKTYLTTMSANTSDVDDALSHLWRFNTAPVGLGSVVAGVYETQTQLFSRKVVIKEIRLYTEPLVSNNSFTIDLIGSGGSVMSNGSQIFTVGTNVTAGEDMVAFNPSTAPTYALGVRITNSSVLGTKNWTGTKMEIDLAEGGK